MSASIEDSSRTERLMPGEVPETDDPSVIERWIEVYAQLLSAKRDVVETLMRRLRGVRPEVRAELEGGDLKLLHQEMRRIESRLGFWRGKRMGRE